MNVTGVQRVDAPTRDVLVVYDAEGDRKFVGFGKTVTTEFADCFIDTDELPIELLKVCHGHVGGVTALESGLLCYIFVTFFWGGGRAG